MRKLYDETHEELGAILATLVEENTDITVREVARRHSTLNNASAFTRSEPRMALIAAAQQRQVDARRVAKVHEQPGPGLNAGEKLAEKSAAVERLEGQVARLVASHAGMIRAVQLAGGMNALERFWKSYKAVADEVHALGVVPADGVVVPIGRATGASGLVG